MNFVFDADQEHQTQAVESVVRLLTGQPRIELDLTFSSSDLLSAVANRLDLSHDQLLANLAEVQESNGIEVDDSLQLIEETVSTLDGEMEASFANFSIEMETGTGKTYVYTRTILELYRQYGLRKFVVVVPLTGPRLLVHPL